MHNTYANFKLFSILSIIQRRYLLKSIITKIFYIMYMIKYYDNY